MSPTERSDLSDEERIKAIEDQCRLALATAAAEHTKELSLLRRTLEARDMQIATLKTRASKTQMRRDMQARVEEMG